MALPKRIGEDEPAVNAPKIPSRPAGMASPRMAGAGARYAKALNAAAARFEADKQRRAAARPKI